MEPTVFSSESVRGKRVRLDSMLAPVRFAMEPFGLVMESIWPERALLAPKLGVGKLHYGSRRARKGIEMVREGLALIIIDVETLPNEPDRARYGMDLGREGSTSLSIEADMLRNGSDRLRCETDFEQKVRLGLVLELTWFWLEPTVSIMELVRGEEASASLSIDTGTLPNGSDRTRYGIGLDRAGAT